MPGDAFEGYDEHLITDMGPERATKILLGSKPVEVQSFEGNS
jgi:hypothetical protein